MQSVQPLEGQLHKYTNVMKGWQYRYFKIDPEQGILEYYMPDEPKRVRPRGSIHLQGAVISPSDEDSNMFTVNSAYGEIYKLRSSDSKERQLWVNRLRAVAEQHAQAMQANTPVSSFLSHEQRGASAVTSSSSESPASLTTVAPSRAQQRVMYGTSSVYDAFSSVQELLVLAHQKHRALAKVIEDLPANSGNLRSTDPDLLLLKATSQATIISMEQCLSMLQQQQQATSYQQRGVTGGATLEWVDPWLPPV
jgi:hypothetical protein